MCGTTRQSAKDHEIPEKEITSIIVSSLLKQGQAEQVSCLQICCLGESYPFRPHSNSFYFTFNLTLCFIIVLMSDVALHDILKNFSVFTSKNLRFGAEEPAQFLRTLAALLEDQGLITSTHVAAPNCL